MHFRSYANLRALVPEGAYPVGITLGGREPTRTVRGSPECSHDKEQDGRAGSDLVAAGVDGVGRPR